MFTFQGQRLDLFEVFPVPGVVAGEHPRPYAAPGLIDVFTLPAGPLDRSPQPISIRQVILGGSREPSFFDDYYNRVYLIPSFVQFGAISGQMTREVFVWNSHFNIVTLNSITANAAEGLVLSGLTPPISLGPLSFASIFISTLESGPPAINATYTFGFTPLEVQLLPVTGVRAQLWPVPTTGRTGPSALHNWDTPFRVNYEFKTDIVVSRSGKEQRRALRSTPRKTMEFRPLIMGDALRNWHRFMKDWQNKKVIAPELTKRVTTTVDLGVGEATVSVDAVPVWVSPGAYVVLGGGIGLGLRRVESVDVALKQITFDSGDAKVWARGTKVYPAREGNFDREIASTRHTNTIGELAVTFAVTPTAEQDELILDAPVEFNGRELFMTKPNWTTLPELTYVRDFEEVDFTRGKVQRFFPIESSSRTYKAAYLGRNAAQAEALRQFFFRMKGRRGEFYMPTFENDLPLMTTAAAGSNSLRIAGRETFNSYEGDTVYRALAVIMKNGTVYLRKVQGMAVIDEIDTLITLADLWAVDIVPGDVLMISWLPVWRHASDILTVEWETDSVAVVSLSIQMLEDLEGV